jgi:hypothetical protein
MDRRQHDDILHSLADVMVHQKAMHAYLRTVIANHVPHMRACSCALTDIATTMADVKAILAHVRHHSHFRTLSRSPLSIIPETSRP